MKKNTLLIAVVALTAILLFLLANTRDCSRILPSGLSQERNAGTEFEAIANNDSYYSPAKAIEDCDTFLAHFQYHRNDYNDDVRAMRQAFVEMERFFSRDFYSYENFKTEAEYASHTFGQSDFLSVRSTWLRLYREADSCHLRTALLSLTSYDFQVYLHDCALQLCQERYGESIFAMKPSDVTLVRISRPEPVKGLPAMECTAVYRVSLQGPLHLRHRTESLSVTGRLSYAPDGKLKFNMN